MLLVITNTDKKTIPPPPRYTFLDSRTDQSLIHQLVIAFYLFIHNLYVHASMISNSSKYQTPPSWMGHPCNPSRYTKDQNKLCITSLEKKQHLLNYEQLAYTNERLNSRVSCPSYLGRS